MIPIVTNLFGATLGSNFLSKLSKIAQSGHTDGNDDDDDCGGRIYRIRRKRCFFSSAKVFNAKTSL